MPPAFSCPIIAIDSKIYRPMTGVSIIIRTRNEAEYLATVLDKIAGQSGGFAIETILIDSDSTDGTLETAARHRCRVIRLPRSEFTWGKALNIGFEAASNECCILLSGHCPPADGEWLSRLIAPLSDANIAATCGRQAPLHGLDPFEEPELDRWYPKHPKSTSYRMFTSAASALKKSVWREYRFDETLSSLEDAEVSARLKKSGYEIKYVPEAAVYHSHRMSLPGIYRRWYWRYRVGMYLRRDSDPRIRRAARSAFLWAAPLKTVFFSGLWYFFKSLQVCFTRGYILSLWKLPFYELARQYSIYHGILDGLRDVKNGKAPAEFSYFRNKIPSIILFLRFIER